MDPDHRSKLFMELQRRMGRGSRPSRPPPPPPRRLTTALSTSTFDRSSLMTSARARSQSLTEESNQQNATSPTEGILRIARRWFFVQQYEPKTKKSIY